MSDPYLQFINQQLLHEKLNDIYKEQEKAKEERAAILQAIIELRSMNNEY